MNLKQLFQRLKSLEGSPKYVEYMLLYSPCILKEIHETKKAIAKVSKGKYFNSYL